MAGAKISLTSVHSFKSYLDPNLCCDFEPEQLLCSTKSWTVNLKSKFDPLPVKTFRLSRSQNKGTVNPSVSGLSLCSGLVNKILQN